MGLAEKMIRARGEVRPGMQNPSAERLRSISSYDTMVINSDYLTLRLTAASSLELQPEQFGSPSMFHVMRADLAAVRNRMVVSPVGTIGFEFGAFAYTERKRNRFTASVFMWGANAPANWFGSKGAIKGFKGASVEDTLRAEALLTYEFWLGTRAVSETVLQLPLIGGDVIKFDFGRETDLWITPRNPMMYSEN